mmetsp:Transcript_17708/g.29545  ORF Transcript_17708/g.29545 Transcript_17708/m.29545 type:complete len:265 (-) Transcript_17708:449-1243(-)|eukprot:CAMPEP_0119322170 /NCGR_PEP_ID=MMETSP1333-20130426/57455_1 /TAXON_ID=418940 /ORGANISM="Scyphosphaera apsteinii, Strain RCC1455" /LENGTH=264 /DNA_ID=CAMNT_0007329327 /DNA_START=71 /DNA_END=865 /DNA_ORIENTATION=+
MAQHTAQDVTDFLASIGLEQCVQAVVHNGFYTSMEALKGATYEELVDSGVRPVHAKLILSNLGSKSCGTLTALEQQAPADDSNTAGSEEIASFLRSVGLENCLLPLADAGFTSLDQLGRASLQDLLAAGIKPVHARLIVSNLDSAASAGISVTPASHRIVSMDEETLLGGPRKRRTPKKFYAIAALVAMLLLLSGVGYLEWLFSPRQAVSPPSAPADEVQGRVHKSLGTHKSKGGGSKTAMHKGAKSDHPKPEQPSSSSEPDKA